MSQTVPTSAVLGVAITCADSLHPVSTRFIVAKGLHNIAFAAYLQLGSVQPLLDLLVQTDRIPEAAFLARTYAPSQASTVVSKWKEALIKEGKGKIAKSIADPEVDGDMFEEGWQSVLARENGDAEDEEEMVEAPEEPEAEAEVTEDAAVEIGRAHV